MWKLDETRLCHYVAWGGQILGLRLSEVVVLIAGGVGPEGEHLDSTEAIGVHVWERWWHVYIHIYIYINI